jgi:hypothetical protein
VMISPLAASRSRLEKWRLASPAAMVFTADPKSSIEHYLTAQRCQSSRAIAAHASWASCLGILKHPPQRLIRACHSSRVTLSKKSSFSANRPVLACRGARSTGLGRRASAKTSAARSNS